MALSKPNLKTLKNSTLEPSIDKSILNVNIDGVLQNKAGAVYVEDPNGYLQKIYITDNFGNYQQLIRTTTKQDIYLGQEFKKKEGYTEVIGVEEVVNGDFATDSDWTKGTGWTIASGVASSDGSVSGNSYLINSSSTAIVGKTYKVEFTISNYIQGNVRVRAGQYASDFVTANGNYTQYMIAVSTETCRVQAKSNFIGSIDNVSVKEDTLYVV